MKKMIISTIMLTMLAAPVTWAKEHHYGNKKWAKVTNVQPITRVVEKRIPHRVCWNEPVNYKRNNHGNYKNHNHFKNHKNQSDHNNHSSYSGTSIGGIVGGAVGNKVSHNKKVGTVIGALLGASVGYELTHQRPAISRNKRHRAKQRHCEVEYEVRYQEKVIGYHVWYRYHGNEYKTRTDNHPGNRIKIKVDVRPYS